MASKEKKQPEKRDDSVKSEFLQRFKAHPFLFIGTMLILVLVVVAFVFLPALVPNAQLGGELVFGYYNKVPVKYVDNNYFARVLQYLTQQQQPAADDPNYMFTVAMLWRQAYEESVVHLGILDEMKEAGYEPPESVVDREVAEHPDFQENGRFSAAKYRALDNNRRLTIWRDTRDSVVVNHYGTDMASLRTASGETSFISKMASPRRNFDLVSFPFGMYPDTEAAAFAAANAALFRVTRLSRITVNSSEQEAQQVLDSVKNGTSTFEDAAKTSSQDIYAEKSGDMGVKMAFELVYEIPEEQDRERVINLAKGELTDLVKVASGWAFFRAEEAVRPADTNDVIQKESIRSYIIANERGRIEDWLIAEAGRFSAQVKENENGFDGAAAAFGLNKQSFGPVPVNYGNVAPFGTISSSGIPELSEAGTNEFFWKAAFTTPLLSPSTPLVIGNNVIVLYPLEESNADEDELEWIETYTPYWMGSGIQQSFRSFFLNSEKLDDRFEETFWSLWS